MLRSTVPYSNLRYQNQQSFFLNYKNGNPDDGEAHVGWFIVLNREGLYLKQNVGLSKSLGKFFYSSD
ncbi:MAG: hypothetical protein Q7S13_02215 [Candidatus Omnitrophota bacterium]|nr:hypothetical protein [Candidatus Omnitrophota bacterium]